MNIKTFFLTVLSTIYLVFSYVVYVWFAFLTFLGLLIPYDVVLLEERPPVGSLSLSINNYFEKSGDLWFMAVIIFSSIILIVTIFRGKKLPANVILFYFAILNCFFGACLILFTLLGSLFKTGDFNCLASVRNWEFNAHQFSVSRRFGFNRYFGWPVLWLIKSLTS